MIQKKLAGVGDPGHGLSKFALADAAKLRHAMFNVLHHYESEGLEPGAEKWQSDTRKSRPILVEDIRREWCRWLGHDEPFFPWHDDFILFSWVSMRKMNNAAKRQMCEFYGLKIPQEWSIEKQSERKEKDQCVEDTTGLVTWTAASPNRSNGLAMRG